MIHAAFTTSCISRFSIYDQIPRPAPEAYSPEWQGSMAAGSRPGGRSREMAVLIFKGKDKAVGTNRKWCENFNLMSPLRRCACSRKGVSTTVLQTVASAGKNVFKYPRPWRTFLIQTSASIDFCFALSLFFFLRQALTMYLRLILNSIILQWCQVLGLQTWAINPLEIFI